MDNWSAKSFSQVMLPLKFAIAVLPFMVLQMKWHDHTSWAPSVALGIGVLCAQLIPPRQSLRWIFLWTAIAITLGAVLPALNALNWLPYISFGSYGPERCAGDCQIICDAEILPVLTTKITAISQMTARMV